jgi:hypothetical protein
MDSAWKVFLQDVAGAELLSEVALSCKLLMLMRACACATAADSCCLFCLACMRVTSVSVQLQPHVCAKKGDKDSLLAAAQCAAYSVPTDRYC